MAASSIEEIASNSLADCATEIGYTAGKHHFVDLWARDSLFACLGDLTSSATKNTIATFFRCQRKDGLIPYRIRRSSLSIKKYFGKPDFLKKPIADFRSFQSGGTVLDGGVMLLFLLGEYVKETGDTALSEKYYTQTELLISFYFNKFGTELLSEWSLCEWADAVMKMGKVLYTNVMYVLALRAFLQIQQRLGKVDELFETKHKVIEETFEKEFWNGSYYADWIDYKRQDYLASFPNLLAVYFDVASKEQSELIFSEVTNKCRKELGILSNYPRYPFWRIPLQNLLLGLADYHNGIFWWQPWTFYVLAAYRLNKTTIYKTELTKIAATVSKYDLIYENYEKDWNFVNRRFYKAEGPFAWSSGLILYMLRQTNSL